MTRDEPGKLSGTQPKEALGNALKRSFDFCAQAVAKVTDAQLADEAASYLRQNGLLPPTAKPAK